MFLYKEISAKRYFLGLIIAIILTGISYLAALSGGQGLQSWLFNIFRFPCHTLFWDFFKQSSTLYRLGLVINIFVWALMLERFFTLIVKFRSKATVS
jgi:hypothetical protein